MRPLLNGLCGLTIAASVWLGVMFVVLHRAGYERGAGMAGLFVLQSLLALAVTNQWLAGVWWRAAVLLGAAGLTWVGVSAVVSNLTGPHFEGFAVIIGALLALQGLFTVGSLITSLWTPSSKVHQFGN
jgi:hypothetical protein